MSARTSLPLKPGRIGAIALYAAFVAIVARTLAWNETDIRNRLPWYLGLEAAYLVLLTVVLWRPNFRREVWDVYFILQSSLILALLSLPTHLDFLSGLFVVLSYQAALVFTGQSRWLWVGLFILLTAGSLMFFLGALQGLALGLIPIAVSIVFSGYVVANQEIESARAESQAMLGELEETHRQLQRYAGQVEELTALEERNRLARELHESVSQTVFSIVLNARSTQLLLDQNPARVRPQLEQLQELTQSALAQMRSLIAQLRVKSD